MVIKGESGEEYIHTEQGPVPVDEVTLSEIDPADHAELLIEYLKELRQLEERAINTPIYTVSERITNVCNKIEQVLEVSDG